MVAAQLVRMRQTAEFSPISEKRGTQEVGRIALCVAQLFQREPVS
jgi:hypothetical protein